MITSWNGFFEIALNLKYITEVNKAQVNDLIERLGTKHILSLAGNAFEPQISLNENNKKIDYFIILATLSDKALSNKELLEIFQNSLVPLDFLKKQAPIYMASDQSALGFFKFLSWKLPALFQQMVTTEDQFQLILKSIPKSEMFNFLNKLPEDFFVAHIRSINNLIEISKYLEENDFSLLLDKYKKPLEEQFGNLDRLRFDLIDLKSILNHTPENKLQSSIYGINKEFEDPFSKRSTDLYVVIMPLNRNSDEKNIHDNFFVNTNTIETHFENMDHYQKHIFSNYGVARKLMDNCEGPVAIVKIEWPAYVVDHKFFIEDPMNKSSVQWMQYPDRVRKSLIINEKLLEQDQKNTQKLAFYKLCKLKQDKLPEVEKILDDIAKLTTDHINYLKSRIKKAVIEKYGETAGPVTLNRLEEAPLALLNQYSSFDKLYIRINRFLAAKEILNILNMKDMTPFKRLTELKKYINSPLKNDAKNTPITLLYSSGNIGFLRHSTGKTYMVKVENLLKDFEKIFAEVKLELEKPGVVDAKNASFKLNRKFP